MPVFIQSDIWKPFKDNVKASHDLTLYLANPAKRSLCFNKAYSAYSLVYGRLLKHFTKQCKVLYHWYKPPTDYRKITAEP